jgi:integrase
MASLVRPWIVSYRDAAGKRVPAGTKGAKKLRERSAKWYGQGIPGQPAGKRFPLATDKTVAKKMLADLVTNAERGAASMPDRSESGLPLETLLSEFVDAIRRKATAKHADTVLRDVRRVLTGCDLRTVADLRSKELALRVERFVWSLTEGKEPITQPSAAYIGKHARQFTRWLARKRKLLEFDPLAAVDLPSQETHTKRRAFSAEEVGQLVAVAAQSVETFRGLTGPARAMLYLLAVATGYRVGELAAMTPANFELDGEVSIVRVKGRPTKTRKGTKNRKDAEQPLPPAVAARLRVYLVDRPAGSRVWPGTWHEKAAKMIHADMAEAGIPIIVDEARADFHSLRHSFTTLLARSAPVKVAQELARHSTPMLTIGRYSHTDMAEKAAAVARLPLPGGSDAQSAFASMSRSELERTAEAILAALVVSLLARPLAQNFGISANNMERHGPESAADPKLGA